MKIYNSLTRKKEEFIPIDPPNVRMYTCGFTMYDHTHIGHVKKYVGDDILRRVLTFNGYEVKHVQNITDVGHLESDADEGEDKMEKGAKKHGLSVLEVARKFEKEFYDSLDKVNVLRPDVIERAADDKAIKEQIKLIQKLLDKRFAYIKSNAVYFDVSKLPAYNPFSNQSLKDKLAGAREGVEVDPEKKNPSDFVLWMFRKGKYANHALFWESPWGVGFPGWHIECSAISMSNLGDRIDIHTGGVDHLAIHHPNEIAQNFGVTGHKVVNFWVHHEFLLVDGQKMSKSLNNFYSVYDVIEKGYDVLALRYFVLGTHYRKQINFTWDALAAAQTALHKLYKSAPPQGEHTFDKNNPYYKDFLAVINDDLNMPQALAIVWKLIEDNSVESETKAMLLEEFDEVLGLGIYSQGLEVASEENEIPIESLPQEVQDLITQREHLRQRKKFKEADEIRTQVEKLGYIVEDTPSSTSHVKIARKSSR